jgi:putative tricarboxylic transport membrane protein
MERKDLISGIFWLALGIMFTLWSSSYQIGNFGEPGPGLLPLILGILLIFFSLILVARGLRAYRTQETGNTVSLPASWKRIAYTLAVLLSATVLFEKAGYLLSIFLFMVFLMLWTEWRNMKKVLLTALLTTLAVYLVFILLLKQPFPAGLLRF